VTSELLMNVTRDQLFKGNSIILPIKKSIELRTGVPKLTQTTLTRPELHKIETSMSFFSE